MLRNAVFLVLIAITGCQSPVIISDGPPLGSVLFREDLWAGFEHRVEVLEAEAPLTLAPGTTTEPTDVFFSERENYLYVIDLDGDPQVLRAIYAIAGRFAFDPENPSRSSGELREALRVDWSTELLGTFRGELELGELEPIAWFAQDDEWARLGPSFVRNPETDALTSIEVPATYYDHTAEAVVLVMHRFDRASD